MTALQGVNRSTLIVAGTVALVLIAFLYAVVHVWGLRQGYVEEIDNIRPRAARLLGIMDKRDELEAAGQQARSVLADVAYPSDRDAAATAAAMQLDIREIVTSAGLSVTGSQILPRRESEGFERLRLNVMIEGNIEGLDEALAALEIARPLVLIELVRVKPERTRRNRSKKGRAANTKGDQRKLSATLELVSLRLKN